MPVRPVLALGTLALGAALAVAPEGTVRPAGARPARADSTAAPVVDRLVVDGAISPASAELIEHAIGVAEDDGAGALVIELDTPGGLVESTRRIVQAMMASRVPVVVWVAPSGARAGSAGVFVTIAAHVAAMAPGTNIGAATPITMGGGGTMPGAAPSDTVGGGNEETLHRKILNDTIAFIRTIAEKRGRNADWAEKAVREAASVTETEAVELHVVDLVAPSLPALLNDIDGRRVELADREVVLHTAGATVRTLRKGLRFKILDVIANPNIAFVLMLIGIWGIFFELTSPGAILPGVVGTIALLLGFFAMQALPVNYVGVLLLLFSLILFVADLKVASHGILTGGGLVAFVLGATMLFEGPGSFFRVSWSVIVPAALLTAGFFAFAISKALRARLSQPTTGREGLVGEVGVVRRRIDPRGQVRVRGELWAARADEPLDPGTEVEVVSSEGLTLVVRRRA